MFNIERDSGGVICHSNQISLELCRALEHKHEFASLNLSWQHSSDRKQTDSKRSSVMSRSRRCQFSSGI